MADHFPTVVGFDASLERNILAREDEQSWLQGTMNPSAVQRRVPGGTISASMTIRTRWASEFAPIFSMMRER